MHKQQQVSCGCKTVEELLTPSIKEKDTETVWPALVFVLLLFSL